MRVIPRSELIAIGGVALVGFTVAALFAVLMVYLLDRRGDPTILTLWGLVVLTVIEMGVTLLYIDLDWQDFVLFGVWFVSLGVLGGMALTGFPRRFGGPNRRREAEGRLRLARQQFEDAAAALDAARYRVDRLTRPGSGPPPEPPRRRRARAEAPVTDPEALKAARSAVVEAEVTLHRARREWQEAVQECLRTGLLAGGADEMLDDLAYLTRPSPKSEPANAERSSHEETKRPPSETELDARLEEIRSREQKPLQIVLQAWHRLPPKTWVLLVLYIVVLVAGLIIVFRSDSARWIGIMLLVVVVLGIANLLVARVTTRFAWYGVTVFLSVLIFGASLSIARTMRTPKVQPAAVVRKSDDVALCGIYITQTDDRVYLGRVEPEGDHQAEDGAGRIFWVAVTDVDVVSVGQLQKIRDADSSARKLVVEIVKDRAQEAAPAVKPTTTTTERGVADVDPGKSTEVKETAVPPGRPTSRPEQKEPTECTTADL
jgi:hypothetical protein